MKVIGMIGYVDKYDFVMNLAKSINIMEKSVLVVDGTSDKKLKSIVPALGNIGAAYVTQYNEIDFAVGFDSMHDIEQYMCDQSINIALYDYILIDIDSPNSYELFRTRKFDKNYFFIDSTILSVAKNKEIIKGIRVYNQKEEQINLTKVVYKAYMSRAGEEYFQKQIEDYNMTWTEPDYEIPLEEQDKLVDIDSQFGGMIQLRKHTKSYIDAIANIAAEILDDITEKEVKNQIKRRKD